MLKGKWDKRRGVVVIIFETLQSLALLAADVPRVIVWREPVTVPKPGNVRRGHER